MPIEYPLLPHDSSRAFRHLPYPDRMAMIAFMTRHYMAAFGA